MNRSCPTGPTYPQEPLRSQLLEGTLTAMAQFVTALRPLDPQRLRMWSSREEPLSPGLRLTFTT